MRALLLWAPPLLVMALIFAGSSIPSDGVDRGLAGLLAAKTIHFTEYLVLMLVLWRALRATSLGGRRAIGAAFAICVLYACSDELHQGFVDGRNPSVVDVAIDAAGAATAGGLLVRTSRDRKTPA
jgi:VanZ family protein